jgi:hypothetical protein
MKKAKLKIDYHHFVNYYYYEKDEILNYAEDSDMFYRGTSKNKIEGEFVRLNPAIFELIEEPKEEEVIEGYAWERQEGKYHFVKPDQPIIEGAIDSILILNPQKTDIEKYKKALHILGSIWFYGDFKAETPNEKELEKIMIELGYKYKSGTAVFLGNPNPKKRKEYVRWVSKASLEHIEGSYGDVILRLNCDITTKRDRKIKIIVEEE